MLQNKAERIAARRIPAQAVLVPGPAGGVVYTYTATTKRGEQLAALAFRGTSAKSEWHYSFPTEEARKRKIQEFWESLGYVAAKKAERAAAKKAWTNPLVVGSLLYTSGGYDQTNVRFYVVSRVSGKRVWIQPIAEESEATGDMSGHCWPATPIRVTGPETLHIAQPGYGSDDQVSVKVGHTWARRHVQGQKHYYSSYA